MDRGCGEGEADCHASDVGHWLAMTGGGRRVTASGGRTPPLQRDRKCGTWLDGGVRAPRPTRGMEVRHKREGQNPAPTHGSRGRRVGGTSCVAKSRHGSMAAPAFSFHPVCDLRIFSVQPIQDLHQRPAVRLHRLRHRSESPHHDLPPVK